MTLQEYEVKRVEPFSFGKITAAFTGLMGLITGLIYLPFASVMMLGGVGLTGNAFVPMIGTLVLGLLLVLFISAIYVGVGFFIGVLYGYLYNYASSKIGGLEIVMDVEG